LVLLSCRTSSAKDIELLVLRHEVAKIGQSEHFTHRAAGPPAMLHRLPAGLFSTTDLLMEPSRDQEL